MTSSPMLAPNGTYTPNPSKAYLTPESSPRSFARAPIARPYASPLTSRSSGRPPKPIEGDSRTFGNLVIRMMEDRSRKARMGAIEEVEDIHLEDRGRRRMVDHSGAKPLGPVSVGMDDRRKGKSLGGSLAGSWEMERAELIVDVPVWSPGCFNDLSTLHSLRDTTLSHTHALIAYLLESNIPASYRLLARSTVDSPRAIPSAGPQTSLGWGCIRLAPELAPQRAQHKPKVRRSSLVLQRRSPSADTEEASILFSTERILVQRDAAKKSSLTGGSIFESAIVEDGEDEEYGVSLLRVGSGLDVRLKKGWREASPSGASGSEEEAEEESADVLVAKEVERRGARQGQAFLMTLWGQPALILL